MTDPERGRKLSPEDEALRRARSLSVEPPQSEWGTITLLEKGETVSGKIPFTQEEILGLIEGREAYGMLRGIGFRTSGREREFGFETGGVFPYTTTRQNLPLLRDRPQAVLGILRTSLAAGKVLSDYAGSFDVSETGIKDAYQKLKLLPDKLKAHKPPTI